MGRNISKTFAFLVVFKESNVPTAPDQLIIFFYINVFVFCSSVSLSLSLSTYFIYLLFYEYHLYIEKYEHKNPTIMYTIRLLVKCNRVTEKKKRNVLKVPYQMKGDKSYCMLLLECYNFWTFVFLILNCLVIHCKNLFFV